MQVLKIKISQEVKYLKESQQKPKIDNQIFSDIQNPQPTQNPQTRPKKTPKPKQENPKQNPTNQQTPTNQIWWKIRHAQCIFSSILSIFS